MTFKGGMQRLAHRWFRLTPSYSPDLVRGLLDEFGGPSARVLDPFAGRGTTPIECQILNVSCVGIEINPILQFAGSVSLNWQPTPDMVRHATANVLKRSRRLQQRLAQRVPTEVAASLGVGFPKIHNVQRWWRPDVLRDLLILKACIEEESNTTGVLDLLRLILANILVDAASITLGRLQLHFVDRSQDTIEAFALFADASACVCDDLEELCGLTVTHPANILLGDSRALSGLLGRSRFDLVITSPPYPNRYSYVWNTRPHLYFFDMFEDPRQAAELDCNTIGGTWGAATSRHTKGEYNYSNSVVADVVAGVVQEIRQKDLLMSNYVAMYFDDLLTHIRELDKCLSKGAVCAYVVGNSRIKKCIVETDLLLCELFRKAGFRLVRLEQIRKRNSGKELHETIVIVKKK